MGLTIHDVARRAAVSISTVSRVLNNSATVSKAKRRRVEAAVAELGYSPNLAARRLVGGTTGGLAVVLPFITGEFFSELISGIDVAARAHNLFVIVTASHRSREEFVHLLREMESRVDGFIIMATESEPTALAELLPKGAPVVLINTPSLEESSDDAFSNHELDEVRFDNYGGAYAIAEHFVAQGFERFAVVRGPDHSFDAEDRVRGFYDALRAHGRDTEAVRLFQSDFSHEEGYLTGQRIAQLDPLPDAVFASNDLSAMGLMLGLREGGLRVPDDVAVAGFDGIPMARYSSPPLTTARIPIRESGARAVDLIVRRIEQSEGGQSPPRERVMMPVELVPRASTDRRQAALVPSKTYSLTRRHR